MKVKALIEVLTDCRFVVIDEDDYILYEGTVNDSHHTTRTFGSYAFSEIMDKTIKEITVFANTIEISIK